jgi:hypothetical protein
LSTTCPPPSQAIQAFLEKPDGTSSVLRWGSIGCDQNKKAKVLKMQLDRASLDRLEPDDLIRLRVLCDFVLDAAGNPVSGAFLSGLLPSGNGAAGGVFESWFTYKPGKGDPSSPHTRKAGKEKAV